MPDHCCPTCWSISPRFPRKSTHHPPGWRQRTNIRNHFPILCQSLLNPGHHVWKAHHCWNLQSPIMKKIITRAFPVHVCRRPRHFAKRPLHSNVEFPQIMFVFFRWPAAKQATGEIIAPKYFKRGWMENIPVKKCVQCTSCSMDPKAHHVQPEPLKYNPTICVHPLVVTPELSHHFANTVPKAVGFQLPLFLRCSALNTYLPTPPRVHPILLKYQFWSNANPWLINPGWLIVVVPPNNRTWRVKWYPPENFSLGFINQGLTLII